MTSTRVRDLPASGTLTGTEKLYADNGSDVYVTSDQIAARAISSVIFPVAVASGGTGQTTAAEALGKMTKALTADATPDPAADYVATYDASADTGKKVLLNDLITAAESQIESAIDTLANLTSIQGRTITLADAGADAILGWDDSAGAYENLTAAEAAAIIGARTQLSADTTFYVRAQPVVATMTQATPSVVTKTAHGLSVSDPIVFSVPTDQETFTLTIANPGVFTTSTTHNFVAGDAVNLHTTGALPSVLPTYITNGTATLRQFCPRTYYVIAAGLGASTFQLSLTSGGAAIDTSAGSQSGTHIVRRARFIEKGTVTLDTATETGTCVGHGLVVGDPVAFVTTGALPTGIEALGEWSDTYYIKTVPTADTFTLSATDGGATLGLSGAQSGTHYLFKAAPLLYPIVEGKAYYVKTVPTADTLTFSATDGGAAINTTGTQVGRIWLSTGNDANDGSAQTRTGAFLDPQTAWDHVQNNVDLAGFIATIQLADGTYYNDVESNIAHKLDISIMPTAMQAPVYLYGNSSDKNAVRLAVPQQHGDSIALAASWNGTLRIAYIDFYNPSFAALNCFGWDQTITIADVTFSGPNVNDPHLYLQNKAHVIGAAGNWDVLFGCGGTTGGFSGLVTNYRAELWVAGNIRLFNDPYFGTGGIFYGEGPDSETRMQGTVSGTYTGADGLLYYPNTYLRAQTTLPGTAPAFAGYGEIYRSGSYPSEVFELHYENSTIFTKYVGTAATTVNALPTAASAGAGARSFVTDANSTTFLATAVGGGANAVPVVSNGTVWVIG
jgi:hypothetical protein